MSEAEVCDLIAKKYEIVHSEREVITLVKKENLDEYKKIVERITR